MGFNSAFKGLKFVKNPGNGRFNNLNDLVLNVLTSSSDAHVETLVPPFCCAVSFRLLR